MAIVALLGVNEQGGIQHFNIPDSLLGVINGADATIGQDGLQISDGTVLKALGNNINGSGIVENEDGSITLKSYTESGRYSGRPIASLAINSNGKLITVPYNKTETKSLYNQTLQENNISGNEGYVTMFNATEDGIVESNIYQNNAGLIGINNPNPFNLLDVNAGSINVTQAVDGHGYKLNNNLIINYDTTNDYLLIGSTVNADVALRRNSTNIGFVTDGGLDLQDNLLTTGAIQFDLETTQVVGEGKLQWNAVDRTLEFGMGGDVTQQIGQELPIPVKHADSTGLTNGYVVYEVGSTGTNKTVRYARADSISTSDTTIGMMTETVTGGAKGLCTTFGLVRGVDTSHLTEGAMVWLSASTAGATTSTKPTSPNHAIRIGTCIRSHATEGEIWVSVDVGRHLNELHDVYTTTPVDLDLIYWNDSNSRYELANFETLGIATAETAWMQGGNTLTESKSFGSISGDFDIPLIRNNTTIATLKSTGLAVPSLTSGYLPKAGTGGLLGNSAIFQSGSNIGLGTITPNNIFDVATGAAGTYGNYAQIRSSSAVAYRGGLLLTNAANTTAGFSSLKISSTFHSSTSAAARIGFVLNSDTETFLNSGAAIELKYNGNISLAQGSGNVSIGTTSGSKKLTVNGDIQGTELTLTTGKALGYVAISDANGKVVWTDPSSLNPWAGNWNASTNTPTLADGTGTYGEWYHVEVAGTVDLGSGDITFPQGSKVIYNGSTWELQTQNYTLNPATASVLGGIKIGSTLEIDAGTGVANQKSGIVTTGTYKSVTVDTYGRVTAGTNPTTLAGYGITAGLTTNYLTKWNGTSIESSGVSESGGILDLPLKVSQAGSSNQITYFGTGAGYNNPTSGAARNTGFGYYSLNAMATGSFNTSVGYNAMYLSDYAAYNVAVGALSLSAIGQVSGDVSQFNVAIGHASGSSRDQINQGIFIGTGAKPNASGSSNEIVIGHNGLGNGSNTATFGNSSITDNYFNGNLRYTGNLYIDGSVGSTSQVLKSGGTNNGWASLLSSDIADWSADLNIGGHITATGGISETLTLTEGSFQRVLKGLYLSGGDTDTRETFFVGTDFNTGSGVFRLQYYNPSDVLSAMEMSFDLADAGRPIVYDPNDTTEAIKHVMFKEDFATMLSDAGVSTGSTPTLQQVLDAGSGDTTKQISLNNSPYITRAKFDELTANFGGAQGLDSVLTNGNTATNRSISFVDNNYYNTTANQSLGLTFDSAGGLFFGVENGPIEGVVRLYSNAALQLHGSKINLTGISEYADNSAASGGGLAIGDLYRTGDILKIVH